MTRPQRREDETLPPTPLWIGTSGFSYDDWVGHFYPPGTRKSDFLACYAPHFNALEINYTYYRMPTARTMEGLVDKSGGGLRFIVKLTDLFTHSRTAGPEEATCFKEALEPLARTRTLGGILAQFPHSFKPGRAQRDYLKRLREWFPDWPVVVEVRNRAWVRQDFFTLLKDHDLAFCCVDEPDLPGLLPPLNVVTAVTGYVRFHGRNSHQWWRHERPEQRYDYLYSKDELAQWLPRLRRMQEVSQELYIFFNNHFEGKAVRNALELVEMLAS